jgi:CBS domain-containing protein
VKVGNIMTRDVAVVPIEGTLQDAAALMFAENVGILPVEEHGRILGVVTDRDIVMRAVAEGENPRKTTVRAVMTPELFYCYEDSDVGAAAAPMLAHQVRRLPVLTRDKQLVGKLSLSDLSSDAEDPSVASETLKAVAHHHDAEIPR